MRKILLLSFILLQTTACSNVKETLGLTRKAPDEFTVMTRAPLTVPPEFNLLPPQSGEVSAASKSGAKEVEQYLYGQKESIEKDSLESQGDAAILEMSGASDANPEIKRLIEEENSQVTNTDKDIVDKIMFWENKGNPNEVLVDPEAESKRIKENQALGKEINQGQVPTIEKEEKGTILDVFK